mgnify:CR=1 FL=1
MYNYNFIGNNEEVIFENINPIIEINNKNYYLSILITNKNLLLFEDINKNNALNGSNVYLLSKYELYTKICLKDINYTVNQNDTLINYNNNEIIIYDFDITKYISETK